MLQEVDANSMMLDFVERLQHNQAESEFGIESQRKANVEKSTQMTLKKFMPTNLTSSFTVMRQKIEKLVEEGLTFK